MFTKGLPIYAKAIPDPENPARMGSVETSHRRSDGKLVRMKGHCWHYGAPDEYSFHEAACRHRLTYRETYGEGGELRAAPAHDGKHDFIFV